MLRLTCSSIPEQCQYLGAILGQSLCHDGVCPTCRCQRGRLLLRKALRAREVRQPFVPGTRAGVEEHADAVAELNLEGGIPRKHLWSLAGALINGSDQGPQPCHQPQVTEDCHPSDSWICRFCSFGIPACLAPSCKQYNCSSDHREHWTASRPSMVLHRASDDRCCWRGAGHSSWACWARIAAIIVCKSPPNLYPGNTWHSSSHHFAYRRAVNCRWRGVFVVGRHEHPSRAWL